jgi:dTDP-4-amino-4,6-dideoxygalactose transaminase
MSETTGRKPADLAPILPADPGRVARARIDELAAAFKAVVESGWFILGKEVETLETAFSRWQGCHYTVGVANGTDALELCLRACGVGAGDLVIMPTHTAVATAAAVYRAGAEPLLLDVDSRSFLLDLNQMEDALKESVLARRIKAVIPVHLYGNSCDMPAIMSLARRYGLRVIEDCSQAHGASWQGERVGSFGDAAAFSCYPTKNLGALGDAGLCITNSELIAEKIKLLRQYGWRERYISEEVGMNSRLDEVHAALLSVQLRYLDEDLLKRDQIAASYYRSLSAVPIELPWVHADATHAYHQFPVLVPSSQRDPLRSHLLQLGINTAILYPAPIHLQPAYTQVASSYIFDRHIAESVCSHHLCLPIHPFLSSVELTRIIEGLQSFQWT